MPDYDARIVDLYDEDNPDGPDHDFYRALANQHNARTILDLGCGTGILTVTLATEARRVVGVDPSRSMLGYARRRPGADDVTWIEGDSSAVPPDDFDVAIMTGNVAQHIPDPEWRRTLHDLRQALHSGGVLAFDSRNPAARAWESWEASGRTSRQTPHGTLVEWMNVSPVADGRVVTYTAHNHFTRTGEQITQTETLTFRSRAEIEGDLHSAGFDVAAVYGHWSRNPFDEKDATMIFVALAR